MKSKSTFGLLSVITIMYLATSCSCSSPTQSTDNDPEVQKLNVYSVVEQYVPQQLKSPSTAEFPSYSERTNHVKSLGNNIFIVESWVDSQNSFGAMIRTHFHLKVVLQGDKGTCSEFRTLQ
ncbi:MAG: hypothetical protein NTW16_02400 [Bacteroidetes bacterium]|nr:hypothetical protein [Bacteroidota bacterium]